MRRVSSGMPSRRMRPTRRRQRESSGQARTRTTSPSARSSLLAGEPRVVAGVDPGEPRQRVARLGAEHLGAAVGDRLRDLAARDVDVERLGHVDPDRPAVAERPGEEGRERGPDPDVAVRARLARGEVELEPDRRLLPEEQPGPEQDGDQAVAVAVRDVDADRVAVLRRAHVPGLGLHAHVHAVVVVAGRRAADRRVGLLVGGGHVHDRPDDALVRDDDVAGRRAEAEVARREGRGRVDRGQPRPERRRGDRGGGRRHDRDAGGEREPQHARDEHGPGRCAAHRSMVPQGQVGT